MLCRLFWHVPLFIVFPTTWRYLIKLIISDPIFGRFFKHVTPNSIAANRFGNSIGQVDPTWLLLSTAFKLSIGVSQAIDKRSFTTYRLKSSLGATSLVFNRFDRSHFTGCYSFLWMSRLLTVAYNVIPIVLNNPIACRYIAVKLNEVNSSEMEANEYSINVCCTWTINALPTAIK